MAKPQEIKITSDGVRKTLKHFSAEMAIAEFIWNGFDAGATQVQVGFTKRNPEMEIVDQIEIADNGNGIRHHDLINLFSPFLESLKTKKLGRYRDSMQQGNEGRGRLTFFKFANRAVWNTTYEKDNVRFGYSIEMKAEDLINYFPTPPSQTERKTGTVVSFTGIPNEICVAFVETELAEYLKVEFGWFLYLNRASGYHITLGGKNLDYSSIIVEEESFEIVHDSPNTSFKVDYVQWKQRLREFSKFYYLNELGQEKFKENSTFNNKGDEFHHSVFVRSRYFGQISFCVPEGNGNHELDFSGGRDAFSFLREELLAFLRKKRRRLLRVVSDKLVESYEKEGVFPTFAKTAYDKLRKTELQEVIRTIYEAEPRVFHELNIEQKKTFVHFLNALLDSDERDRILSILDTVLKLDEQEQAELIVLLQSTTLNRIIKTIGLIEDRYKAVSLLKELLLKPELKANEVEDIQEAIEAHYWLFGEEYHLVTAAEPDFEEALRRFQYILRGEAAKPTIEHPHKNKEMDIFAVRQIIHSNSIESIVIELKHPKVTLGEKELSQVKKYLSVVREEPRFNASNNVWKFILVGSDYNSFIDLELKNSKHHGEQSLVYSVDNQKIYVKRWSEVFNDFECRHNFLNKQLMLQRSNMTSANKQKTDVLRQLQESSASIHGEVTIGTNLSSLGLKPAL